MSEEKGDLPVAADAQAPETTEQLASSTETLPDAPVNEVERLKTEYADIVRQNKEIRESNAKLEGQLKEGLAYISRTRNPEKVSDGQQPQKTLDDYLEEVTKKFEDDPKEGFKKVIRDIAYDRDLERAEYAKNVTAAEERAFKKMLALNPESNKTLKEIEKLDEECPDLRGLSFERKVEFINLRNGGNKQREIDVREKANRETNLASSVGGSNVRGGGQKIPSWVNDPEAIAMLQGHFATKQEALDYADPDRAKRRYEEKIAKQRKGQLA